MKFYRCLPRWKQFEFLPRVYFGDGYFELTWGCWILSKYRH